jgi:phage FluMu gp28-like protein
MKPPINFDSKSPLLHYQKEWIKDKAPFKAAVKSRRVGLTYAQALDDVLTAAMVKKDGGMDCLYMSTKTDLGREYIDTCREWVRKINPLAEIREGQEVIGDEGELAYTLVFPSGHKIMALSSNPSNMRGLKGRITIDEVAFHDQIPELIKAAGALLMWGGEVRLISTLNGVENDYTRLCDDIAQGKKQGASFHKITIDDALDQGLYFRIRQDLGKDISNVEEVLKHQQIWLEELISQYGEASKEELYCIPRSGDESYFDLEVINRAMSKEKWDNLKSLIPPEVQIKNFPYIETYYKTSDFFKLDPEQQKEDAREYMLYIQSICKSIYVLSYTASIGVDFGRQKDLTVITVLIKPLQTMPCTFLVLELRNVPHHVQEFILTTLIDSLKGVTGIALDAGGNGSALSEAIYLRYRGKYIHVNQVHFTAPILREYFQLYKNALENQTFLLPPDRYLKSDHIGILLKNGVPKAEKTDSRDSSTIKRHCDSVYSLVLAYQVFDSQVLPGNRQPNKVPPVWATGSNYRLRSKV